MCVWYIVCDILCMCVHSISGFVHVSYVCVLCMFMCMCVQMVCMCVNEWCLYVVWVVFMYMCLGYVYSVMYVYGVPMCSMCSIYVYVCVACVYVCYLYMFVWCMCVHVHDVCVVCVCVWVMCVWCVCGTCVYMCVVYGCVVYVCLCVCGACVFCVLCVYVCVLYKCSCIYISVCVPILLTHWKWKLWLLLFKSLMVRYFFFYQRMDSLFFVLSQLSKHLINLSWYAGCLLIFFILRFIIPACLKILVWV